MTDPPGGKDFSPPPSFPSPTPWVGERGMSLATFHPPIPGGLAQILGGLHPPPRSSARHPLPDLPGFLTPCLGERGLSPP
jgi:hypothetical protein